MASNLSTIGFAFDTDDSFAAAMTRLAGAAQERVPCPAGEYAIWRDRSGASIWFHLVAAGDGGTQEIVGLTPFYEGKSEVGVKVTGRLAREGDNAFEGGLYAWIAPDADEGDGEGAYPAVLDAVDFAALAGQELPVAAQAQICGFARELQAFPSEAAYTAARADEAAMAPQAFVPLGLFAAAAQKDGGAPAPASEGLITGRVLEHRRLTNVETGLPFHWLLVESFAAIYDVLADPEVVKGEIVEGGIVEAPCAMFCRMVG